MGKVKITNNADLSTGNHESLNITPFRLSEYQRLLGIVERRYEEVELNQSAKDTNELALMLKILLLKAKKYKCPFPKNDINIITVNMKYYETKDNLTNTPFYDGKLTTIIIPSNVINFNSISRDHSPLSEVFGEYIKSEKMTTNDAKYSALSLFLFHEIGHQVLDEILAGSNILKGYSGIDKTNRVTIYENWCDNFCESFADCY